MKKVSENVWVNEILFELSFKCRKEYCNKLCCKEYIVDVTEKEIKHILSIMDFIKKFKRTLKVGKKTYKPFFEEIENSNILVSNKNGCIFLYKDKENYFCAIHSACNYYNLALNHFKPRICLFWPLEVSYIKKVLIIDICEDYKKHNCISESKNNPILLKFLGIFRLFNNDELYKKWVFFIEDYYKTGSIACGRCLVLT